jgi:hypothetical protein
MKEIKQAFQNTKDIMISDSSLNTLLDFERVLDELDLYAFKNWKKGELVEGPIYEKYFMWPYKLMPNPKGGLRLAGYDCEVTYKEDKLVAPIKVTEPGDFKDGTKMPKEEKHKIWLIEITMPKKLMQEIHQGSLELETETIDLEDVNQAYEDDLDANAQNEQAPEAAPEEEMNDIF